MDNIQKRVLMGAAGGALLGGALTVLTQFMVKAYRNRYTKTYDAELPDGRKMKMKITATTEEGVKELAAFDEQIRKEGTVSRESLEALQKKFNGSKKKGHKAA